MIDLLVQHGAKVNEQNSFGETPLYLASMYGHPGIVIALLRHGARVDITKLGTSARSVKQNNQRGRQLEQHGDGFDTYVDEFHIPEVSSQVSRFGFPSGYRCGGLFLHSIEPRDRQFYIGMTRICRIETCSLKIRIERV